MAFRKRFRNRKRQYRRKKGKWRQQKLAVGTVQRIAKDIAQREDKKNLVKYVHPTYVKSSTLTWASANYQQNVPDPQYWQTITGGLLTDTAFQNHYVELSAIGGNINAANMTNLDGAERGKVEVRVHGMQVFGIVKNSASHPTRFEARLIYIPNANIYTNDANDYIRPRITMFWQKGVGGLIRQGYDRRSLAALTATGIPVKFQELARKVIHLPAASVSGSVTVNSVISPIVMTTPPVRKRFTLAKYFKQPRRAFMRSNQSELSNGSYYLVYWCDLPSTANTMNVLAVCNFQYSLKAPMHDDLAT